MEATKQTKMTKEDLHLSWKDKLNIIRDNRYFLMLFPIVMLAVMILIFGVATAGRFFKLSVMKGILSQAIIIGTCATGVAFIYSNGNLDISIGAVLGLAATLGVKAYNVTQSVVVMILATLAVALGLMAFNCTMSVVCNIKTITVAIVVTQIYGAMRTATMAPGFSYTKGTPVMKIEARPNPRFLHTLKGGDMLFDLQNDPHQEHVLEDAEQSDRLLTAMTAAFEENDSPEEMYSRYGLKQYRKKAE